MLEGYGFTAGNLSLKRLKINREKERTRERQAASNRYCVLFYICSHFYRRRGKNKIVSPLFLRYLLIYSSFFGTTAKKRVETAC